MSLFPFHPFHSFSSISNHLFSLFCTFCVEILVNICAIHLGAPFVWSVRKLEKHALFGGLHNKIIRCWKGRSFWTYLTAGNRFDWRLRSGDSRFWTCRPGLDKIWGNPPKTKIVLLQRDTSAIPPFSSQSMREWRGTFGKYIVFVGYTKTSKLGTGVVFIAEFIDPLTPVSQWFAPLDQGALSSDSKIKPSLGELCTCF